jgi:thiamine-monophosphate kinase
MTRSQPLTEFELIGRYFTRPTQHTVLGIGDDAALLTVRPGFELVAATDMMVEGTHFFSDVDAEALGHKILAVNLSDLAAMGAKPRWAMLAMAIPQADAAWLEKFARGFFALAQRYDVDLIGGDTTGGPLNLCVQIMGEVEAGRALRRDGAKIGDEVWVSGQLGEAALAVAHIKGEWRLPDALAASCRHRLEWPQPRVALGRGLIGTAHSVIDISDGLLADLGHICERSGVGAIIDFDALPCIPELRSMKERDQVAQALLAGGDDYELCFTVPPGNEQRLTALSEQLDITMTRVGSIMPGNRVEVRGPAGRPLEWKEAGFEHFR